MNSRCAKIGNASARRQYRWRWLLLAALLLLAACTARLAPSPFVTGLNQPRGLAFDAEGNLYVAEAGTRAVPSPGETSADTNHSGRVLRISPDLRMATVVGGLPFTYYKDTGDTGASDVALLGNQLYLLTGEGYDDQLSRAVLRATAQRTPEVVASFLSFAIGLSTSQEQEMGIVQCNPYAMVVGDDSSLYVSDGASGRIYRVAPDGDVRVFAELPMMPLTGLAFGPDGRLYVAMFSLRPHTPATGAIWAADPTGHLSVVAENLTMPIDVGFDAAGVMYVLEFANGREPTQPYAPRSGRLLRIAQGGAPEIVLTRLNYPTAMAFSRPNDLYIAVGGAFSAAGRGEVLMVPCQSLGALKACPRARAMMPMPQATNRQDTAPYRSV